MADDISRIGFEADASGLKDAARGLDEMAAAASRAEEAARKLADASQKTAQEQRAMTQAASAAAVDWGDARSRLVELPQRAEQAARATANVAAQTRDIGAAARQASSEFNGFIDEVVGKATQSLGPIGNVARELMNLAGGLTNLVGGPLAAGAAAGGALFLGKLIQEADEFDRQRARIENVIRSMNLPMEETRQQAEELQQALQRIGVTEEQANRSVRNLLTMTEIPPEMRERVAMLGADMAEALNKPIETSMRDIAGWVSNPDNALSTMRRQVKGLSEEWVQRFKDIDDATERQRMIFEVLEQRYSGAAAAVAQAGASTAELRAAWNELWDTLAKGDAAQTALQFIKDSIREVKDLVAWLNRAVEAWQNFRSGKDKAGWYAGAGDGSMPGAPPVPPPVGQRGPAVPQDLPVGDWGSAAMQFAPTMGSGFGSVFIPGMGWIGGGGGGINGLRGFAPWQQQGAWGGRLEGYLNGAMPGMGVQIGVPGGKWGAPVDVNALRQQGIPQDTRFGASLWTEDVQDEWVRTWDRAMHQTRHAFEDFFLDVGKEGKGAFEQLGENFTSIMQHAASNMLAEMFIQPFLNQFMGSLPGVGGARSGMGGGGAMPGGGFFGDFFARPSWGGMNTVGGVIGGGLMGYGIGSMNMFGGTQLGSSIGGTLGGLAGSFFGPVGGILGSLAGSALGGLFGNNQPSNNSAGGYFDPRSGVINQLGNKGGQNVAARDQLLSSLQQAARQLERETGGQIGFGRFNVDVGSRDGTVVKNIEGMGGARITYGGPQQALEDMTLRMARSMTGLSDSMREVIEKAQSASELAERISFAKTYDEYIRSAGAAEGLAGQLYQMRQQLEEMTDRAEEFGLSSQRLRDAFDRNLGRMREEFNRTVHQALLGITDPIEAQLGQLEHEYQQRLKDAQAIGGNIVEVERLYALQRQQILAQANGEILVSVRGMATSIRQMLTQLEQGPLSPLAPGEQYQGARAAFLAAGAQAQTGMAPANLNEIISNFLNASRSNFASSEQYAADWNQARALLTGLLNQQPNQTMQQEQILSLTTQQVDLLGQILGAINGMSNDNRRALQDLSSALFGGLAGTRAA